MTTPTPLPLDAAALDALNVYSGSISDASLLNGHYTFGQVRALVRQSRSALTLAARVAELEAELAEDDALRTRMGDILTLTVNALKGEPDSRSLHDWATLPEVARSLVAHATELRDASVSLLHEFEENELPWPARDRLREAVARTPAQSLAAHDAEVLERAAGVCDVWAGKCADIQRDAEERWDDVREAEANAMGATAEELAAAIRALAAQAQEVKP